MASTTITPELLDELLDLTPAKRALRLLSLGLPALAGGSGEGEGGEGGGPGEGGEGGEGSGEGEGDGGGSGEGTKEPDWKREARKHEDRSKKNLTRAEKAEEELAKLRKDGLSEQDKKVQEAADKARAEAKAEGDSERRADRLELASTRLAAKGIKLGEGDKAATVKFADPEDAVTFVQRAIKSGDVDETNLFDDEGKVQTAALTTALEEILENKPHLRASTGAGPGSADARKGAGAGKSPDDMSVEDHAKRKYPAKP